MPPVRVIYWSMRVMAFTRRLCSLVAARRRVPLWKQSSSGRVGSCGSASSRSVPLPFVATTAGWILTEIGRQPWIVQGLLKTADANSPTVSSACSASALTVFVMPCTGALAVVDFWLMRRYARVDPPELDAIDETDAVIPHDGVLTVAA